MPLNAYWAYGFSIHTDLVCPELPRHPHPTHDPDVTIILLPQEAGTLCPLPDRCYEVRPGCFRLDVPGVARYRVEEGKRIFVEPLANASPEKVRLFLLGSTMSALLYQRGLLPLHGSAVEYVVQKPPSDALTLTPVRVGGAGANAARAGRSAAAVPTSTKRTPRAASTRVWRSRRTESGWW